MQLSQTRQERRAAERKARKFARKATQPLLASPVPAPAQGAIQGPVIGPCAKHGFSPELEDEFSPESLSHARSLYDRFENKAAARRSVQTEIKPAYEPAVLREAKIQGVEKTQKNKSTGPRTPAGKLASSGNSLKHGLAAPRLIIPGEDRAAFEALLADLLDEHQPAGPTEEMLVHQIAQSWWLAQRALRFQNECFTAEGVDLKRLSLFLRYQTTHERAFHRALSTLIRLKKDRARGFVSENHAEASRLDQFVSQNTGVAAACDRFVLKNDASENQFEGIAA